MNAKLKLNNKEYNIVLPLKSDYSDSTIKIIAKNVNGESIEISTDISSTETIFKPSKIIAEVSNEASTVSNIEVDEDSYDSSGEIYEDSSYEDSSEEYSSDESSYEDSSYDYYDSSTETLNLSNSSNIQVDENDIEED